MAFILTAEVRLAPPRNTNQIAQQINRQLNSNVQANVNVNVPRRGQRNLTRVNKTLNQTGKAATAAASSMQTFGEKSALAARRFGAFVTATFAFRAFIRTVNEGIGNAIEFQRELVRIAQVTNRTIGGLSSVTDEVQRLATGLGVSSQELLGASRILSQTGLRATEVRDALQALAKADLSPTFGNIVRTTEASVAIFRQFNKEAGDLEESLSSINAVAANFAVESDDISTAIRRAGGAFAAAGGDLNELVALFTSVRSTTRESAQTIATGFRTIFTRLQRSRTINLLDDLGVKLRDVTGQFVGPFEAINRLSTSLSNLQSTDPRFSQITEELGGFRQVSKVIPLIQQFATAQRALAVAQQGTGSLTEDAATAQQALAVQIRKVREEFEALVRKVVGSDVFQGLSQVALKFASSLVKVSDALAPLATTLSAISLPLLIGAGAKFSSGFLSNVIPGKKFASGGTVLGGGDRDTVPALLTPGEFVVNKKAVNRVGVSNLEKVNKFADGGLVGSTSIQKQTAQLTDLEVAAINQYVKGSSQFNRDVLQKPRSSRERQENEKRGALLNFGRGVDRETGQIGVKPHQLLRNQQEQPTNKNLVSSLISAINKGRATTDLTLFKGIGRGGTKDIEAQIGTSIESPESIDKAFRLKGVVSTSRHKGIAQSFGENLLTIQTKSGIKLLDLSEFENPPEQEVLLQHGSKFRINGIGTNSNDFKLNDGINLDVQKLAQGGLVGGTKYQKQVAPLTDLEAIAIDDYIAGSEDFNRDFLTASKDARKKFGPKKQQIFSPTPGGPVNRSTGKNVDVRRFDEKTTRKELVSALTSAINKGRATQEFKVFRGIGPRRTKLIESQIGTELLSEEAIGKNFRSKGINSATFDRVSAEAFGSLVLDINTKKGGKLLDLSKHENKAEQEVLFQHGQKFGIRNVEPSTRSVGVQQLNSGGIVPGQGNTDSVPALLTPGEFVIRKSAVQKVGEENLQKFNQGGLVGYQQGGLVSKFTQNPVLAGAAIGAISGITAEAEELGDSFKELLSVVRNFAFAFSATFLVLKQFSQSSKAATQAQEAQAKIANLRVGRAQTVGNIERAGVGRRQAQQELDQLANKALGQGQPLTKAEKDRAKLLPQQKKQLEDIQKAQSKRLKTIDAARQEQEEQVKASQRTTRGLQIMAGGIAAASAGLAALSNIIQKNIETAREAGDAEGVRTGIERAGAARGANLGLNLGGAAGLGLISAGVLTGGAGFGIAALIAGASAAAGALGGFTLSTKRAQEEFEAIQFQPTLDNFSKSLKLIDDNFVTAESQAGNIRRSIESINNRLLQAPAEERQNIRSDIQSELPTLNKFFDEVLKGSNTLNEFTSTVGDETIRTFAELSNVPVSKLTEQFERQIKLQVKQVEASDSLREATNSLEDRFRAARDLTNSLRDANNNVQGFNRSLSEFASGGVGSTEIRDPATGISDVGNIANIEQFNRNLDRVSSVLGNQGQVLADEVRRAAEVSRELPDILLNLRGQAFLEEDFDFSLLLRNNLERNFRGEDFSDIRKLIVSTVEDDIIGREGDSSKAIEQLTNDIPGFISKITEQLQKGVQPLSDSSAIVTENLNKFAEGLSQATSNTINLIASQNKVVDIQEERQRFLSEINNRPTNVGAASQFDQRRLSNILGGAGDNPLEIGNRVQVAQDRIQQLSQTLSDSTQLEIEDKRKIIQEQEKERENIQRATKALEFLSDASSRTSVAQRRLNEVVEAQSKKFNQLSDFVFGDRQSQRNQVRTIQATGLVAQGVSPNRLPEELRASVQGFLREFSDVALPIFGGQTGQELEQNVVQEDLIRRGIAPELAKVIARNQTTTEEQRLIEEIKGAFSRAEEAQSAITDNLSSANQRFLDGLQSRLDRFLSEFRKNIEQQQSDRKASQERERRFQEQLQAQREQARSRLSDLTGTKVEDDSDITRIRNNLSAIKEFSKNIEQQGQLLEIRGSVSPTGGTLKGTESLIRQFDVEGAVNRFNKNLTDRAEGVLDASTITRIRESLFDDFRDAGQFSSLPEANNPKARDALVRRFNERASELVNQAVEVEQRELKSQFEELQPAAQQLSNSFNDLSKAIPEIERNLKLLSRDKPVQPKTQLRNSGGFIPGVGNTDTVPAMLTPGEFVIRKEAASSIGLGNLNSLNSQGFNRGGKVRKFALGGLVPELSIKERQDFLKTGHRKVFNLPGLDPKQESQFPSIRLEATSGLRKRLRKQSQVERVDLGGFFEKLKNQQNRSPDKEFTGPRDNQKYSIDKLVRAYSADLSRHRRFKSFVNKGVNPQELFQQMGLTFDAINKQTFEELSGLVEQGEQQKGKFAKELEKTKKFISGISQRFGGRRLSRRRISRINKIKSPEDITQDVPTSDLKFLLAQRKRKNPFEEAQLSGLTGRRKAAAQRALAQRFGRFDISDEVANAARKKIESRQNGRKANFDFESLAEFSGRPIEKLKQFPVGVLGRIAAKRRAQERAKQDKPIPKEDIDIQEKVRRNNERALRRRQEQVRPAVAGADKPEVDIQEKVRRQVAEAKIERARKGQVEGISPNEKLTLDDAKFIKSVQGSTGVRLKVDEQLRKQSQEQKSLPKGRPIIERAKVQEQQRREQRRNAANERINFVKNKFNADSPFNVGLGIKQGDRRERLRFNNIVRDISRSEFGKQSEFLRLNELRRKSNPPFNQVEAFGKEEASNFKSLLLNILNEQKKRQGFQTGGPVGNVGGGGGLKLSQESIQGLSETFSTFSNAADKLARSVETLNGLQVQHQIGGTLEVIFNGAEVFSSLEPKFVEMATAKVEQAINKMLEEKFPDAGSFRG